MTDAELVHETLRGDRSAYEQLVRRWSGPVTGFVRSRVRRVDISDDLAQEVLLRHRNPETPTAIAKEVTRPDESVNLTTLGKMQPMIAAKPNL